MSKEPKEKNGTKQRRRRRNYASIVSNLKTYCEIHLEILEASTLSNDEDFSKGMRQAFKSVLERLDQ